VLRAAMACSLDEPCERTHGHFSSLGGGKVTKFVLKVGQALCRLCTGRGKVTKFVLAHAGVEGKVTKFVLSREGEWQSY
jgi:hypothetical protein